MQLSFLIFVALPSLSLAFKAEEFNVIGETKPVDCSLVRCDLIKCAQGYRAVVPYGKCCPVCVPIETKPPVPLYTRTPVAPPPTHVATRAPVPSPTPELCVDDYLSMSDEELFSFQDPNNKIGDFCYVQKGGKGSACDFYVKAEPSTISSYNGWPRTTPGDAGTGCVKNSSGSFCYFNSPSYDLTASERNSMCTANAPANAAAQLRHAIKNGACGKIPTCRPKPCVDEYLAMSDKELFSFQGPNNKIGDHCYVQLGGAGTACDYYVKAEPSTISSHNGWPRTTPGDAGTGCVKKGGGSFCYFNSPSYALSTAERSSMCSADFVANAAAQLRHAIENGACGGIPKCPCSNKALYKKYAGLSDKELFNFQDPNNKIGDFCYVQQGHKGTACNFYVKARPSTISPHNGWPRTTPGDAGTGCVKDHGGSFCYFNSASYALSTSDRSSMCTSSAPANAAAQLRHAIANGACCKA